MWICCDPDFKTNSSICINRGANAFDDNNSKTEDDYAYEDESYSGSLDDDFN